MNRLKLSDVQLSGYDCMVESPEKTSPIVKVSMGKSLVRMPWSETVNSVENKD